MIHAKSTSDHGKPAKQQTGTLIGGRDPRELFERKTPQDMAFVQPNRPMRSATDTAPSHRERRRCRL